MNRKSVWLKLIIAITVPKKVLGRNLLCMDASFLIRIVYHTNCYLDVECISYSWHTYFMIKFTINNLLARLDLFFDSPLEYFSIAFFNRLLQAHLYQ